MTKIYDSENSSDFESDMESDETPELDSIVSSVINKFMNRAEFGKNKYGTDLDREDLTFLEWVNHAQEEHMDAILYLEKIRHLETRRLTETSSRTNTWELVAQCVTIFAAVIFYNSIMIQFLNSNSTVVSM